MRVRTKDDYAVPFLVDLGQRNAVFRRRRWTPLARLVPSADAFAVLPEPDYDLVHAINAVPVLDRRPYVVTFEDYLPRVPEDRPAPWLERRLRRALLEPRCVRVLAISEYARRQLTVQSAHAPERDALLRKVEVLRPAVRLRPPAPTPLDDRGLRLAFVGADFLRKGGPALVRAHDELRAIGIPIETTVVSSLRWSAGDYIGPPDAAWARREHARVAATPGLRHIPGLPNASVLEVLDHAHLLALPTLHDTFGYVSLEAMAGGTPVIASATCALPEVVEDGASGFLLPLEGDGVIGKWAWTYRSDEPGYLTAFEAAIEGLATAIVERCVAVWERREDYPDLRAGARARARDHFGVERARDRLEVLYEECRSYRDGGRTMRNRLRHGAAPASSSP